MKRIVVLSQILSLAMMWIFASQTWASGVVTDTAQTIQVSGLEAYPQITIALVVWLLVAFVGRYTKTLFGRFMLTCVSMLTVAILSPIWFESAAGSLTILSPQIAKATGVSDWPAQSQLISNGTYNHLSADLFVIFLIAGFIASITASWIPAKGSKATPLTTRIDNLPSW
jgi:hypothetical protein